MLAHCFLFTLERQNDRQKKKINPQLVSNTVVFTFPEAAFGNISALTRCPRCLQTPPLYNPFTCVVLVP